MKRVSRKKYQEALACLKAATKNPKLPWLLRIRACELIMTIYGLELPQNSGKAKRSVRELVEESAFERQLREQVNEKIKQDAEADAKAYLERINT